MSTRGSRARHAAGYRHGAGFQIMSAGERQLQQRIMAQREPHRWGRGDEIMLDQERVVISGISWQGNEATYMTERPGQPGWKRMSQAALIEQIHTREKPQHRKRYTAKAAPPTKDVLQMCEGFRSVGASLLKAHWPLAGGWYVDSVLGVPRPFGSQYAH